MPTQYMHAQSHSYGPQSFDTHDHSGQNGKNANFAFKKRLEHIDWRKIASIDIDQISRTLDFNALQENVMNLTFCNIESELDMRMVDPNFMKLFKLAQFTIEYLLHSQDYLAGVVSSSEEKVKLAEQEMMKVREEMEKLKGELTETKKESHKRKKLLIAQQQMMHAGADSYHKCPFCSKAFLNISFLQAHIFRRHNDHSYKGSSSDAVHDGHTSSGGSMNKTLEGELNNIKDRLQMTEAALKEEKRMNRSLTKSLKNGDHQTIIDINREVYQDRLHEEEVQREVEDMKNKYEGAIHDLNQQLQSSERALIQLKNGRRSNLGSLEDDDDDQMNHHTTAKQSKEVSNLQEELLFMKSRMEKQDKKWSRKFQDMLDTNTTLMKALEKTDQDLLASQKSPVVDQQHRENENILRKSREQEQFLNQLEEEMDRNDEQNRLAEKQRKSRRYNKVITAKETVVETIDRRNRSPGLQAPVTSQSVRRSPSPRRDEVMRMEPSDDDDEETELGTGTGSMLNSGRRSGTLGSTQGSYGNRSLNTVDYINHLRNNPTMDIMRKEILAQLDQKLENIGVDPTNPGITDYICDNKLAMLKTQRNVLERRHMDFMHLRQKYDAESTAEAKRRYREMRHSPILDTRQSNGVRRQTFPQPIQSSAPNPSPRPRASATQPVPTPRSSKNLQSTGSTTEWTSTNWDSDEDSEYDSDPRVNSSAYNRTPNTAPRLIVSKPLPNHDQDESLESESESLEEPVVRPRVIISKPKGDNVSKLSQSIEYQLNNRGGMKKPVGGVNTINSNEVFDDWDSDEEEDIKPRNKRPPTRASTEYSSNTYDTSQWGSSSKVASTVHHETKRSGSKSSFVSVTDVSSDDDLNTENI